MQAAFPTDILLPQTPKPFVLLPGKPSALLASTAIRFRPSTPSLRTPELRIRAASSSSGPPPPPPPQKAQPWLLSLLKPACVTLAAAAALLAAGLHVRAPRAAFALDQPPAEATVWKQRKSRPKGPITEEDKERLLEEYLELHPDDIRSLRALMVLRFKAGRYAEAVEVIDRLAVLVPSDQEPPLLKAHILSHAGDTEAAREGFEALIQKNPYLIEAYHGLVMTAAADATKDTEEAEMLEGIVSRAEAAAESCRKAKKREEARDFRLLVAQIRVMEGRYDEALKVYQELVREEPRDFRPYLCQGIVYSVLRRKDEADKQFDKYRRLVPKGHPYASYFEDNFVAAKVFGQSDENKRADASASLSR